MKRVMLCLVAALVIGANIGCCGGGCGLFGKGCGAGGGGGCGADGCGAGGCRACAHDAGMGQYGGPATGAVTYPYYTTRGPRDFLAKNPRTQPHNA